MNVTHVIEQRVEQVSIALRIVVAHIQETVNLSFAVSIGIHSENVDMSFVMQNRVHSVVDIGIGHEITHLLLFIVADTFHVKPINRSFIVGTGRRIEKHPWENAARGWQIEAPILTGQHRLLQVVHIAGRTTHDVIV